jgi:serine phosphatase RsbU (regulator of sigma subunit)
MTSGGLGAQGVSIMDVGGRRRGGLGGRKLLGPTQMALLVGGIGLVVTLVVSWTAWTLNRHSEHRLLEVQTRQAGAVINSTILDISDPLATALQIATATAGNGPQFIRFMSSYTGSGRLFASASLWEVSGTSLRPVTSLGSAPQLRPSSSEARAFMARSLHSTTFVVTDIQRGGRQSIGYAIADSKNPTFAVYAERAIPANRRVPVERDSAFADLNYATYLGSTKHLSDLATTDMPVRQLPLSGDTSSQVIPFGDTTITLVAGPRGQLGGSFGANLPWIFLVAGILLTLAAAAATDQLVRRGRLAEEDAQTIAGLYDQLDGLYGTQRSIAETLQRALLPQSNPTIANLEIASRYVAGADGVDIGGDWYSLIPVDEHRFAFAVGDVSGRGISAATVMARLRFTVRAYLVEGHPPDVVLAMCSRQLDVGSDGHFATVLVGVADLESREITIANAGHMSPLIVSGTTSGYVTTSVGLPLGVAPGSYEATTVRLPLGSTFLVFTDGLVERRTESIEVGLERLARAVTVPSATLDDMLTAVVSRMAHNGAEDDIAVLAFRWVDAPTGGQAISLS